MSISDQCCVLLTNQDLWNSKVFSNQWSARVTRLDADSSHQVRLHNSTAHNITTYTYRLAISPSSKASPPPRPSSSGFNHLNAACDLRLVMSSCMSVYWVCNLYILMIVFYQYSLHYILIKIAFPRSKPVLSVKILIALTFSSDSFFLFWKPCSLYFFRR